MRHLQEECGELVAAINQYLRGRISVKKLSVEIGDVLLLAHVMYEQFPDAVDKGVEDALVKLQHRLAKNNPNVEYKP
jgi:NTP pyrophosphatase (non-canonical NTP hydrolase)